MAPVPVLFPLPGAYNASPMNSDNDIDRVRSYLLQLQDSICDALAEEDGGAAFISDEWQRPEGGGGRSRVLTEGAVFERAGVNFSHVHGASLPPSVPSRLEART